MNVAIELLKVATRFDLPDLAARAMCVLRSGIDVENVATIFQQSSTSFPSETRIHGHAMSYILMLAQKRFSIVN